jgi:hypothetical protein
MPCVSYSNNYKALGLTDPARALRGWDKNKNKMKGRTEVMRNKRMREGENNQTW